MLRFVLARFLTFCLLALLLQGEVASSGNETLHQAPGGRPWRILHVMGENQSLAWSEEQFSGFKEGLGDGLQIEYQVAQLDARNEMNVEVLEERAKAIRKQIKEWEPDLLYVSDDAALDRVVRHFADTTLPCVFSGVRQDLRSYGLTRARNITGVLEQVFFMESFQLLQQIKPHTTRIHLITDTSPYNKLALERIRRLAQTQGTVHLVGWDSLEDFSDFQKLILSNPKKAEAFILLGDARYKAERGSTVALPTLHRWLDAYSKVPEIAFRGEQVRQGALAGVTTSAHAQGFLAGQKARQILVEGREPSSIPVEASLKGVSTINLARAQTLGLIPRAKLLLSSVVRTDYEWKRR